MVRDGILFVACRSSTWANELTLLKPEILKKLQSALGRKAVKDVRFSARGFKKAQAQAEEAAVDVDSIALDQSDLDAAARIASAAPPEMAAQDREGHSDCEATGEARVGRVSGREAGRRAAADS